MKKQSLKAPKSHPRIERPRRISDRINLARDTGGLMLGLAGLIGAATLVTIPIRVLLRKQTDRGDKTMKRTMLRNMKSRIIMTVVILMISVVSVTAQSITAQDEAPERSLEGVWLVKTTPRNCATGDPMPTAAFESLYTFHKDGTMLVSLRNNSLVLERTAAHGLWRRDRGWSDYSFKFVHLRRNLTTGLFAGKQEGGGSLVLSESGDEFTTDGRTLAYNVDGTPAGPGGCANSVGTRFKLEP